MNDKERLITDPLYFCPKCRERMTVTFQDLEEDYMNMVRATCPNKHNVIVRIKKDATEEEITEQLAYFVERDGGRVLYE